jgi:hypothetical protein
MIHIQIWRLALFTVFMKTYDPVSDVFRKRCFRVRWV